MTFQESWFLPMYIFAFGELLLKPKINEMYVYKQ